MDTRLIRQCYSFPAGIKAEYFSSGVSILTCHLVRTDTPDFTVSVTSLLRAQ